MGRPLTDDQRMLQDAARDFFADRAPVAALRAERDQGRPFDPALWREAAALGFAGALVPEELGGSGMGYRALGVVLEAAGRTLAATPLLQTGWVGVETLLVAGTAAQRTALLPALATGSLTTALCIDEGAHHEPSRIALVATRTESGWRIDGRKRYVADGATADRLIVVAREDAAPRLFWVDAGSAGLSRRPLAMADSRGMADIRFDAVALPADALLVGAGTGSADDPARAAVERILDVARIGLAAEMSGAIDALFALTLDHLKTRKQFGQPIGAFQALQHRAARLSVEIELTRSCILAALDALDDGAPPQQLAALASLAKARAADTLQHMSNEAVQLLGGIGMTDAHDAGLYLKRARVQAALYGSAAWHRDRSAKLEGY